MVLVAELAAMIVGGVVCFMAGAVWERAGQRAEELADLDDDLGGVGVLSHVPGYDLPVVLTEVIEAVPAFRPALSIAGPRYDQAASDRQHQDATMGIYAPRSFGCCEHCRHDVNDPPHEIRCPEGCVEEDWSDPADWAPGESDERPPSIAELAEDAEYRLCWRELAGLRASAYDWYERSFGTGQFRAVT